jgi:hypothetical protein
VALEPRARKPPYRRTGYDPSVPEFVGQWRQIRPDPDPAAILLTFADGGQLTYTVTLQTQPAQQLALLWRVDGDTLVATQRDGSNAQVSRFRFPSASMLVLEREGERYVYRRL